MFKSMTSDVSALSSGVAKGHQTVPTFLLPPLKFRTAGFPQYGFKPERFWRPSLVVSGLSTLPAYTICQSAYTPALSGSPHPVAHRACQRGFLPTPSSPEALGSAAGYVVLPRHGLLWPHLSLSLPPADL